MSNNNIQETIDVFKPYLNSEEQFLYTQVVVGLLKKQHIAVTNQRILLKNKELMTIPFEEVTDFLKGDERLFFFFNDRRDGVLTEETIVLNNVTKIKEVYHLVFRHWRKLRPEIKELTKADQIRLLDQRLSELQSKLGLTYSKIEGLYKKYEGTYKGHPLLIKLDVGMPIKEFSIELELDNPENLHFNLSKEVDMLSDWRDWFGRSEYKTGVPIFDDMFYLISDNVQLSRRLFTDTIKRSMMYCQRRADCVWIFGDGKQKKKTSESLFSTEGDLNVIENLLDDMLVVERKQKELKVEINSPLRFTATLGAQIQENGGKIADLMEKSVEHIFEMVNVVDRFYRR